MFLGSNTISDLVKTLNEWTSSETALVPARSLDEFQEITSALCTQQHSAKVVVGWLYHGHTWEPYAPHFDSLMQHWSMDSPYFKAWIAASEGSVSEEATRLWSRWWCVRGPEHWKHLSFDNKLDDFYWIRDIEKMPGRRNAQHQPLSSIGALELMHSTQDNHFLFAYASKIAKGLRNGLTQDGMVHSGARSLLESTAIGALSPTVGRMLLVNTLLNGDSSGLTKEAVNRAHEIWHHEHNLSEKHWWETQAVKIALTSYDSETLLGLGLHPLALIHHDKESQLQLLADLRPELFRSGYALQECLSPINTESMELPDLDGPR